MRVARWLCLGFLAGIAIHSLWPHVVFDLRVLTLAVCVSLLGVIFRRYLLICCFIFACALGMARFEMIRPTLSPSIAPLNPDGFVKSWEKPEAEDALSVWIMGQRAFLTRRIQTVLPGDEGQLLAGMLYGERGLSKQRKDGFKRAGLTHLIAVSGSNVTIIVVFISRVLVLLKRDKRESFMWLTVGLVSFVLFVLPQAPVVRAAIMGWLFALAPLVGRIGHPWHVLRLAAVVYVAWQPTALLFEPSFALSFLATIGVMVWGSWLDAKLEGGIPSTVLREAVTSTFGATLLTTPYTMWAFGQASGLGLVANLVAVPLVPWAMALGFVLLALPIAPIAQATKGFLYIILFTADAAAKVQLGYWKEVIVSPGFMLCCYLNIWLIHRFLSDKAALSNTADRMMRLLRGPFSVKED
jgi:ComEC/Rec2-related protein